MAYDNERLVGNDTLNNVPDKGHYSKTEGLTKRITITDIEAFFVTPRMNINASGVKRGTKNGLGEKSLF